MTRGSSSYAKMRSVGCCFMSGIPFFVMAVISTAVCILEVSNTPVETIYRVFSN